MPGLIGHTPTCGSCTGKPGKSAQSWKKTRWTNCVTRAAWTLHELNSSEPLILKELVRNLFLFCYARALR